MERKINWLALLVAAVVGTLIGFIWYSVLFQDIWAQGHNITVQGEKYFKNGTEMNMSLLPMIVNFIVMFVYALLIDWLISMDVEANWMNGVKVGGAVGVIMALGVFTGNMFAENQSSLSMVDGFYSFVLFSVIGAIVGGWQKK